MTVDRRAVLASSTAAVAMAATDALAQAGAGASAPGAAGAAAPQRTAAKPPERVVTLEEHFWARSSLPDRLLKQAQAFMRPKLQDDLSDLGARRLSDMDQNGITVQVISATAPGAEVIDGQEGIQFAKTTNDMLADAVRRHPDRFAGFAHLPMLAPEAAADELERAVTRLGFRGALINGATQGRFLDDPRFAPVLARAAKLDVPIYLHPNFPSQPVMDAYYSNLPGNKGFMLAAGMFGWHAEVGMHVLRMALAGTFEAHPGLNLIIGHMGEMLPFMLGRIDHAAVDFGGIAPVSPILRERVYITTAGVFDTPALLTTLMTFGADRILFSVDYPYSSPVLARRWLDTIPVSPADRQKIVHGNADRLLRLA